MTSFWQDLRYAIRGLGSARAFFVLAILALALGIGAVTTIFSVIQNALLNPFPYTDAERLMTVGIHDITRGRPGGRSGFKTPEFMDYIETVHSFDRIMGATQADLLYSRNGGTEQFDGAMTTGNSFEFLGIPALLGRGITPGDAQPGAPPIAVMSYKVWDKSFGRDPKVLNQSFILNGVSRTIVGIMPPRFTWFAGDFWIPITLSRSDPDAKQQYFFLVGHLRPGVSRQQATAEVDAVAHRLATVYKDDYPKQFNVQITSLAESVVGSFRTTLFILMGAVGMLLLIACVNVANMLLARATAREKEIAIRSSLGASRWRLARQFLAESLVLAICGAIAGCLVAFIGIRVLVPMIPENTIPKEAVIQLNVPVLLFTLAVAVGTALLFGLLPGLFVARGGLAEALKDTGKGVSGGFRHGRFRTVLGVSEITLSLVLLVGAGLLIRSFFALEQVDLGFNPNHILVARLPLPKERYKTIEQKHRFFAGLLLRLENTPGILYATETSTLPPYGGVGTELDIPGKTHSDKWRAIGQLVSEHYFQVLGLKLVKGRLLEPNEVADARKVAVVNQTLVHKFFPGEDPIGRHVQFNALKQIPDPVKDPTFEIIGVVSDAKNQGIQEAPIPEMFVPYTVTAFGERGVLVRTVGDPMRMLETVRKQIWSLDSNVALTMTGSLDDYLKRFSYSGPEFGMILISVFAGVGLVLAGIGVYSVVSYTVSRRTHEIGIRLALGASYGNVLRMVFRMGLTMIGLGIVVGLLVTAGTNRLLASQLWGISSYDPVTIAAVVLVLILTGLAACYFPARKAMRVDPIIALRYE